MSGPGGMVTKRDQRRESRREQYQRRQAERQRERQRQIRQQRIQRYGLIGGGILIVLLLALGISQFIIHNNSGSGTSTGLNAHPATGQTVDGLQCLSAQGGALHIHQYLDLYVNGQQVTANPGIGIVNSANCLYPLHVHDNESNVIHNETNQQNVTFTLGQFFDLWGVKLSSSQVGGYKVDSSHKLVIKLIDKSGNVTTYTGNPYNISLGDQETIYVLYNSPNVSIKPYTNWQNLGE